MRYWLFLIILMSLMGVSCSTMPTTKTDYLISKTNEISIDKIEAFQGPKRDLFTGQVEDLGNPIDVDSNSRCQQLVRGYLTALKKELEKEGFVLIDNPNPQTLVLKTKISDDKPTKGLGWTFFGQGIVIIQISVYQNNTLISSFGEAANYSILSIETQVQRLTPRIAAKIKENLLN